MEKNTEVLARKTPGPWQWWLAWWNKQSPNRQDRFANLTPVAAVILFLAAIASAFWYLRAEETEREQEAVKQARARQNGERRQVYAAEIRSQIAALENRLDALRGSMERSDRSQASLLAGRVADLNGDLMRYTA